jgi:hypothetical protein
MTSLNYTGGSAEGCQAKSLERFSNFATPPTVRTSLHL